MKDYIYEATDYVIENARYSNARTPPPKPYMVRFPASSGRLITAGDTHKLVKMVAAEMRRRAAARDVT